HFSGTATAQNLGRPGNGGDPAAAIGARSAGEFCGGDQREDSGEPELYGVERDAGVVRGAVQAADGDHHQVATGKNSAASSRQANSAGRGRGGAGIGRALGRAADLVSAGKNSGTRAERR